MRLSFSGLIIALTILFVAGCSTSPPSQYYFLTPLDEPAEAAAEIDPTLDTTVVEVQVRIARYLDRPQIITRLDSNEFRIDEFNRWAGSFKDNITTALIHNLTSLLENTVIARRPIPSALPVDYVAFVDIIQFDGVPGQSVTLRATWGILRKGDKAAAQSMQPRSYKLTLPVESKGYDALVAAKSQIIGDLSRKIAQALTDLQNSQRQ
jgi:uncharacterized lipoprotein YmbA